MGSASRKYLGGFELLERLGRGGMADVWLARTVAGPAAGDEVVVKVLREEHNGHSGYVRLFEREAALCMRLRHPNIVHVRELGHQRNTHYQIMDHVDGFNLLRILARASDLERFMPAEVSLYVGIRVCRALEYAHRLSGADGQPMGIVHLDVTPSNILIGRDGTVKLADFGLAHARLPEEEEVDGLTTRRGKRSYMAPEQLAGAASVDRRADVYALGIVLCEMLTMRPLFKKRDASGKAITRREEDPRNVLARFPHIPPPVQSIVLKALATDPAERYATAGEFEAEMSGYLRTQGAEVTRRPLGRFLDELAADTASQPAVEVVRERRAERARADSKLPPAKQALVRSASGAILGPVSPENLIRMVAAGSLGPGDLIAVNGGRWRTLQELPGLEKAAAAAGVTRPEVGLPSELRPGDMLRVLADLGMRYGTKHIRLERGLVRKDLTVHDGRVLAVRSTDRSELFGSYLVRCGVVHPKRLKDAIRAADGGTSRLGGILVEQGVLGYAHLGKLLEDHLREKLLELCSWNTGSCTPLTRPDCVPNNDQLSVDVLGHLAEGTWRYVSEGQVSAYLATFGRQPMQWVTNPTAPVERLALDPRSHRFLHGLKGRPRALRALLHNAPTNPGEIRAFKHLIFLLLHTGHLRPV